jgi:hypothetical protein
LSCRRSTTIYSCTLTNWWAQYELASQREKLDIVKCCIDDIMSQNCRFLQRIDDGTRNGYYVEVPPHEDCIRRKVSRNLRQEAITQVEVKRMAVNVDTVSYKLATSSTTTPTTMSPK